MIKYLFRIKNLYIFIFLLAALSPLAINKITQYKESHIPMTPEKCAQINKIIVDTLNCVEYNPYQKNNAEIFFDDIRKDGHVSLHEFRLLKKHLKDDFIH